MTSLEIKQIQDALSLYHERLQLARQPDLYGQDSSASDVIEFDQAIQNSEIEEFHGILNQVNALEAKINYLERKSRSNEEENEILKANIHDLQDATKDQ